MYTSPIEWEILQSSRTLTENRQSKRLTIARLFTDLTQASLVLLFFTCYFESHSPHTLRSLFGQSVPLIVSSWSSFSGDPLYCGLTRDPNRNDASRFFRKRSPRRGSRLDYIEYRKITETTRSVVSHSLSLSLPLFLSTSRQVPFPWLLWQIVSSRRMFVARYGM